MKWCGSNTPRAVGPLIPSCNENDPCQSAREWIKDDATREEFQHHFPKGEADVIRQAETFDKGVEGLREFPTELRKEREATAPSSENAA
jgi:hypothetical protein